MANKRTNGASIKACAVFALFGLIIKKNSYTGAKKEAEQRHLYPDEIKTLKEILNVSYDVLFEE